MRFLLCLVLVFLVPTTGVFAQESDDFYIRIYGAEDTIPPTTPTLSGSAIAHNQIDVSWSVSTDNFLVSGYVLYRDGSPISTTTQTSYSDVSVSASSTYVYSVRAFDPSFNYSSSSNLVSITTPITPVTPVDSGNAGGGTSARVVLNELTITPGFSTSTFYMRAARPARFEMRWGKTDAYELGYIVNDRFVDEYRTTLTELEPGTTYFYEVVGYTPSGMSTVLEQGKFKTLDKVDFLPPSNVLRFTGFQENQNVRLAWQNPQTVNFASVRIVRSHLGFPTHPQDGVIVYQGTTEGYVDRDILAQHSPVYYTAFVYDANGNVSSGSIVRVYRAGEGQSDIATPITPPLTGDGEIATDDGFASTSPSLPPGTKMPDLSQIFLLQNNNELSFAEPVLTLTSSDKFVVSIPKEAVTVNLKTIIATMTDPTDSRKTYSVLLKLNKEKTAYEAVVAALMVEGMSQVTIDIYDYSAQVVGTYRKTVTFVAGRGGEEIPVFPDLFIKKLPVILLTILPFLLGSLFWIFYRRRREAHEDNN
jgi:hypothetical protein